MWLFFFWGTFFWHTTLKRAQVLFGGRRGYTLIRIQHYLYGTLLEPSNVLRECFLVPPYSTCLTTNTTYTHIIAEQSACHAPGRFISGEYCFQNTTTAAGCWNAITWLPRRILSMLPKKKKNRCSHFVFQVTKDRSRGNATRLTLFFTRVGMVPFVRFPNTPTRGNGENGETG